MSEIVSLNPDSLKQWQEQSLEIKRYQYDLRPDPVFLDIGSYRREWGTNMIQLHGGECGYFDGLDGCAAWLFDGEITMGGDYYYTSMFTPGDKKVRCVDIAPYLNEQIDVMKVNIEGGEYALLSYIIEKGLMKNIVNLQVQFHLIEGRDSEKEYTTIAAWLSKTHELIWRYPFCWENWKLK